MLRSPPDPLLHTERRYSRGARHQHFRQLVFFGMLVIACAIMVLGINVVAHLAVSVPPP